MMRLPGHSHSYVRAREVPMVEVCGNWMKLDDIGPFCMEFSHFSQETL